MEPYRCITGVTIIVGLWLLLVFYQWLRPYIKLAWMIWVQDKDPYEELEKKHKGPPKPPEDRNPNVRIH